MLKDTSYSPWHILQLYMRLTSHQVPPGGPLLVTLHKLFSALTPLVLSRAQRSPSLASRALGAPIPPEQHLSSFIGACNSPAK